MTTEHTTTARNLAETALRLDLARNAAEEIQWEPSPVPKPREDTTERAKGGHGDPTLSIVLDERRLALREAVQHADNVARNALEALTEASRELSLAIDKWNGD